MTEEIVRKFRCLKCEHQWGVPFGGGRQLVCPKCGSMNIHRTNPGVSRPGKQRRRCGGMRNRSCEE